MNMAEGDKCADEGDKGHENQWEREYVYLQDQSDSFQLTLIMASTNNNTPINHYQSMNDTQDGTKSDASDSCQAPRFSSKQNLSFTVNATKIQLLIQFSSSLAIINLKMMRRGIPANAFQKMPA